MYHQNLFLTRLHPGHPAARELYLGRGDPGFFGNLFHAVTGVLGGAIKGFVTGGPLGGIAGAVGGAVHATASNIGTSTLEAGGGGSALTPALRAQHAAALARGPRGVGVMAPGGGVQHRGGGGRRRRMNWANGRALARAERRMMSFLHHARRFIKLSHPKAVGVHLKLHRSKRRAA